MVGGNIAESIGGNRICKWNAVNHNGINPKTKICGNRKVPVCSGINNCITYEILGPIAPRAVGLRVNKFGKEVPEKYTWVDPRTGEQLIRKENGAYTPIGTRLRSAMQKRKINKSDYWSVWIDREFVLGDDAVNNTNDPWAT